MREAAFAKQQPRVRAARRSVRSDTALALPVSVGGILIKKSRGGDYGRADNSDTDNGTPMACCQRVEALLSFGTQDERKPTQ